MIVLVKLRIALCGHASMPHHDIYTVRNMDFHLPSGQGTFVDAQRDPFELMENIEEILGIKTYPMNWPIGCGKEFKGVFDRNTRKVLAFSSDGRANGVKKVEETEAELGDAALDELLTPYLHQQLVDEIELLDGAAEEFDLDKVLRGDALSTGGLLPPIRL